MGEQVFGNVSEKSFVRPIGISNITPNALGVGNSAYVADIGLHPSVVQILEFPPGFLSAAMGPVRRVVDLRSLVDIAGKIVAKTFLPLMFAQESTPIRELLADLN